MNFDYFNIENYKGIDELTIKLGNGEISKVFTLIGLNESGKTTVLEALYTYYFYCILDSHKDAGITVPHILEKESFILRGSQSDFSGDIKLSAAISCSDGEKEHIVKIAKSLGCLIDLPKVLEFKLAISLKYESSKYKSLSRSLYPGGIKIRKSRSKNKLWKTPYEVEEFWNELAKYIYSSIPEIIYYPDFAFDFPYKIYLQPYKDAL